MFSFSAKVLLNNVHAHSIRVQANATRFAGSKAQMIADRAAEIAPRLTGEESRGFVVGGEGDHRTVTNTSKHFKFVELGTRFMPAEPALGPAARMAEPTFAIEAAEALRKGE